MRFANPNLLWLLLVIPPGLLGFLWWSAKRKRALLTRFIEPRLLAGLLAGVSPARRRVRYGLLAGAVACFVVALARPQWGFDWEEVKQRGLDIIVAIDTSKSMLAEDVTPNRLARAKLAALELVQLAKSDRIGLIAFAGSAFLQCPLTIDDVAFAECVEVLDVNIIPQGGTAIAEAILTAARSFKSGPDDHKVLVIFSDGEDHDQRAVEAAAQVARAGIKIFTVGIGSAEGDLLRIRTADGRTDYVRDPVGNVVKSRLNEAWLQQIATAGGGFYLALRGAKAIQTLYERGIAPLPKTEGEGKLLKRWREKFHWPLLVGIVLLILEMVIRERPQPARVFMGWPFFPHRIFRPQKTAQATASAGAMIALLFMACRADGSPMSALRDYRAGRFDEALQEYQRLIEKGTSDARLHFNAGAAAYRLGKFDAAARHFEEALGALPLPLQQRAYYNLGNAFYRLGEQQTDSDRRRSAWQQALKQYELALKLDRNDQDAQFNYEFVRQKLQELDQQMQQQPQVGQPQQHQQQNQQETRDQDQSAQQNKSTSEKTQQQPETAQKPQQGDSRGQNEQQQSVSAEAAEPGQKQSAAQAQVGQPDSRQMTHELARQMLDALRAEETMIPLRPEPPREPGQHVFKDW